jgi:hypothetical protein
MSYQAAAALQSAVYARLAGWGGLTGVTIVDEVPAGGGKGTFVLLGPETATDKGDATSPGTEHQFQVSVISDAKGFLAAKAAAAAVSAALINAPLTLTAGILVGLQFQRAVARRLEQGDSRRIDMTFRARVDF